MSLAVTRPPPSLSPCTTTFLQLACCSPSTHPPKAPSTNSKPVGNEAATDTLAEILDEVEAASGRSTELGEKFASLLWGLGEALCRRGRAQAAAVWLSRALPFLSELGRSSAGWRALAFCHQAAGDNSQARRCAETALSQDPSDANAAVLIMKEAAIQGEVDTLRGLISKATCPNDTSSPPLRLSVTVIGENRKCFLGFYCVRTNSRTLSVELHYVKTRLENFVSDLH